MKKRITLATIKSFIKKSENLHIKCESSFDGMVDCVIDNPNQVFRKAVPADKAFPNNLGIAGAWFVFGSRDYFSHYEDQYFVGYSVYNCCGSFIIANAKQ